MRLVRGGRAGVPGPCALTIGSFDGLHVGHQSLLRRAVQVAGERGLNAAMLSFEPLPREYFRPADPPARLTNLRERWRALSGTGLKELRLLHFNAALQVLPATGFLELLRALQVRCVVVGHDFHFGRAGEGSVEWCAQRAPQYGFDLQVVPPVLIDGERVSSGLVREALAAGDFARAARLLGRPYTMCARVQRGAQLGRTLGFPTANLRLKRRRTPLSGIFAVRATGAGLKDWPAVASLGTRPTVNGVEALLEVHLFDCQPDLYGRELEVQFVAPLRPERRFATLDLMVEQMHRDAAEARVWLNGSRLATGWPAAAGSSNDGKAS